VKFISDYDHDLAVTTVVAARSPRVAAKANDNPWTLAAEHR